MFLWKKKTPQNIFLASDFWDALNVLRPKIFIII